MSTQSNKSIKDGFSLLYEVAGNRQARGCRELARDLGMETSRVNRLCRTMTEIGILRQDSTRKYSAGPGIHALSAQSLYSSRLVQAAGSIFSKYSDHNYLLALGTLWLDRVNYLFYLRPDQSSWEGISGYPLVEAELSSIGQVLLSAKPHEEIKVLFSNRPVVGEISFSSLINNINAARQDGYAACLHNNPVPHYSIAMPLPGIPDTGIAVSDVSIEEGIDAALQLLHNIVTDFTRYLDHSADITRIIPA
jgi:DNA-binding IclR family transcriptional regulator